VIPRLADDEEHSLAEIAERMNVDVETLRADLFSLVDRDSVDVDVPPGFVEGVQMYIGPDRVKLVSNHFRRPMRLTTAELCALELGLAMLRTERPPDEHRAIDGARARLRLAISKLPPDDNDDAERNGAYHATVGAAGDVRLLANIRASLRRRQKLDLRYRRADAGDATARTICPYALVAASGTFYVVAYCESSDGLRIFRLDRIESAETTSHRFEIPADFSLENVLREGKAFLSARPRALRVRYSSRIARWIAEREGGSVEADGSLTLEHPLADVRWAVRHVLQYGPDAEVLDPPEARQAVRDALAAMAGAPEREA
jgi:proteasome accessory factor C